MQNKQMSVFALNQICNVIQDVIQACAVGGNLKSSQIILFLSILKVNEIIHLYVYLSVFKLQIENKHVSAMDYFTFFLFGHCWILPT